MGGPGLAGCKIDPVGMVSRPHLPKANMGPHHQCSHTNSLDPSPIDNLNFAPPIINSSTVVHHLWYNTRIIKQHICSHSTVDNIIILQHLPLVQEVER